MPGMSGLKVLKKVKELYPKLPVLMFSFLHEEDERVSQALKLGADGYLIKWHTDSCFLPAIERIVSGGQYFAKDPPPARTHIPLHQLLSKSEYKVFYKLADGKSVTEISREMSLNKNTVSTYKQRIFEKLEFDSDIDMFRYAAKMRLI
jgi:two-component system invasion response regulator UvrY